MCLQDALIPAGTAPGDCGAGGRSPHSALQMGPVRMWGAPASNAPTPLMACMMLPSITKDLRITPQGNLRTGCVSGLLLLVSSSEPHGDGRGRTSYLPVTGNRPLRARGPRPRNNSSTWPEAHPQPNPRPCEKDAVTAICGSFKRGDQG